MKSSDFTKEEIIDIAWREAINFAASKGEDNVRVEDVLAQLDTGDLRDIQAALMDDLIRNQIYSWAREQGIPLREE
jgi:hypothetical protein